MSELVLIDGSVGEGGGQIIRTSVSLSALTGRPVQINNVRARRTKPGLQPQHLMAVRAAATLCNAQLSGAEVGSSFFYFEPRAEIKAGDYLFDIGTAGAAPLVAQTVLVPLTQVEGRSRVVITGGTHVPHAPTADYLQHIYAPVLQQAGLEVAVSYSSTGFYPRGGGQIELQIGGATKPKPLNLTQRGQLKDLNAFVVTSNLPEHVAERGVATVERAMKAIGRKVNIQRLAKPSIGPGAAVVLTAQCQGGWAGFSSIGELRRPMEKVAETPCKEFLRWWKSGAACDEHLADQLVLPMALAQGQSHWTTNEVSEHLRTVLWVAQQFLPMEYHLEENTDGTGCVRLKTTG